jgi:hypothetical protein
MHRSEGAVKFSIREIGSREKIFYAPPEVKQAEEVEE